MTFGFDDGFFDFAVAALDNNFLSDQFGGFRLFNLMLDVNRGR